MAGTIKHSWDGTVLTITSDSGTSSCNLVGPTGDEGPRGPQGIPGGTCYQTSQAAYNFLDNSDFTRFVAQSGVSTNHGVVKYAGDRWIQNSGDDISYVLNEDGSYNNITLKPNTNIAQIIDNQQSILGHTLTAILELADGTVLVKSAHVETPQEDYTTPISHIVNNVGIFLQSGGNGDIRYKLIITNEASNTKNIEIKNVMLIEGEYTEETRPAYTSKGYGVELFNCMRYYKKIKAVGNILTVSTGISVGTNVYFDLSIGTMRTSAPTVNFSGLSLSNSVGGFKTTTNVNVCRIWQYDNVSGIITIRIEPTTGTIATEGTAYRLGILNGGYIEFSADL